MIREGDKILHGGIGEIWREEDTSILRIIITEEDMIMIETEEEECNIMI